MDDLPYDEALVIARARADELRKRLNDNINATSRLLIGDSVNKREGQLGLLMSSQLDSPLRPTRRRVGVGDPGESYDDKLRADVDVISMSVEDLHKVLNKSTLTPLPTVFTA